MDDGIGWLVTLIIALVVASGVGYAAGKDTAYGEQCAASCAPRQGKTFDGKCFCLDAVKP
jgi:hypothetical protein